MLLIMPVAGFFIENRQTKLWPFGEGDVKSQEQQAEVVTTSIKHRLKINRLIVRILE